MDRHSKPEPAFWFWHDVTTAVAVVTDNQSQEAGSSWVCPEPLVKREAHVGIRASVQSRRKEKMQTLIIRHLQTYMFTLENLCVLRFDAANNDCCAALLRNNHYWNAL